MKLIAGISGLFAVVFVVVSYVIGNVGTTPTAAAPDPAFEPYGAAWAIGVITEPWWPKEKSPDMECDDFFKLHEHDNAKMAAFANMIEVTGIARRLIMTDALTANERAQAENSIDIFSKAKRSLKTFGVCK